MVNVNSAFPSKYVKAEDLKGQQVILAVDRVQMEDIGDSDRKPVMYFQGREKGLVLNKTNAETIAYIHGPETDNWSGHQVELFVQMVSYQGRMVPGIRCRAVPAPGGNSTPNQSGADRMSQPHPQPAPADGGHSGDLEDEIPW